MKVRVIPDKEISVKILLSVLVHRTLIRALLAEFFSNKKQNLK
jgi:hypothetical protein